MPALACARGALQVHKGSAGGVGNSSSSSSAAAQQGRLQDERGSGGDTANGSGGGAMQQAQQYDFLTQQILVSRAPGTLCCEGGGGHPGLFTGTLAVLASLPCLPTSLQTGADTHTPHPGPHTPQADLRSSTQQSAQIEATMRHVSTLNQMISTAVMAQADMIEQLYNDAVKATHHISRGNVQLKKTIALNRSSRNWVLVLSVVAGLLLLFFDWFYS